MDLLSHLCFQVKGHAIIIVRATYDHVLMLNFELYLTIISNHALKVPFDVCNIFVKMILLIQHKSLDRCNTISKSKCEDVWVTLTKKNKGYLYFMEMVTVYNLVVCNTDFLHLSHVKKQKIYLEPKLLQLTRKVSCRTQLIDVCVLDLFVHFSMASSKDVSNTSVLLFEHQIAPIV